jgi:hypothetical protein
LHPDEETPVSTGAGGETLGEAVEQGGGERGVDALDGVSHDTHVGSVEARLEKGVVVCFEGLTESDGEGDARWQGGVRSGRGGRGVSFFRENECICVGFFELGFDVDGLSGMVGAEELAKGGFAALLVVFRGASIGHFDIFSL